MLRSLTSRVVLVTAATAVVSVIFTALVALPLAVHSANKAARAELVRNAEMLAADRATVPQPGAPQFRSGEFTLHIVPRGTQRRAGLPDRVVRRVAAGAPVTTRGPVDGRRSIIVGRPLPDGTGGLILTRPVVSGLAALMLGGVWMSLLAGLLAGVAAGAALARLTVRPIRQAAAAAGRLSAGDRSVRLATGGPAEAAELASAFNQLAAALATSEGRERDFLLSVSHELRTPLATIRGYAEALADGVVAGDGAARAGGTMLAEADRLDRLIADLLVLSRLEAADLPLDVARVDVAELVRAAYDAWLPRCVPDGPELRAELPAGPVLVDTDPGRVRQVVDGLCENALRIVPQGAPLVLAVRAEADAVVIEVRDGGPGFTDDDLAVAFERGALHQRYRGIRKVGSGLGLALAARLVTRLGGRIEAGHAPEGGARFTVALPRPEASSGPVDGADPYRSRTPP